MTLTSAMALTACGGSNDLSREFGVSRDAPGTTGNPPRQPLWVPPTIADRPLRPGASAAPLAAVSSTSEDAAPVRGASAGQRALVNAAGADTPPADIRQQIDDNSRIARANPQFVDYLMNWSPPPGNATIFQPVKKGWFSRIF